MSDARRDMFGYLAETARVVASPSRIELLDLLVQGERSVEALAEASLMSVANVSQHLQQLRHAGVVLCRRAGKQAFYRLADGRVLDLLASLRSITEDNAAAAAKTLKRAYLLRDPSPSVSQQDLLALLEKRAITLIDVRPGVEFKAAHIPGALSMPVATLPEQLNDLSKKQEVIAYCRGPYCVFAYKAMEILRPVGYRARRLDGGFTEWRRAHLPMIGVDIDASPLQ